jgi:type II secretory pathway component PulJ
MKNCRAFTIVEVTVATLISAVVIAACYETFTSIRAVSERENQSMDESWQMLGALETIREDLMHAVPIAHGDETMFAADNPSPDVESIKLLGFYALTLSNLPPKLFGTRLIHRIEYQLLKESDSNSLYRVEEQITGADKKLIAGNIEEVRILIHDGRRFVSSYSSKYQLPAYIEIELAVSGQKWPLAVRLPCGYVDIQ